VTFFSPFSVIALCNCEEKGAPAYISAGEYTYENKLRKNFKMVSHRVLRKP
jgi:hypothetical protein